MAVMDDCREYFEENSIEDFNETAFIKVNEIYNELIENDSENKKEKLLSRFKDWVDNQYS